MHRAAVELSCLALLLALGAVGGGCEKPAERQVPSAPAADAGRTTPGPYQPIPLTILEIAERSITVKPRFMFASQTQPSTEQRFAIDRERTKVFANVVTDEQTTEQGQVVQQTKLRPADLADLKVGDVVYVGEKGDGVATDIIITPPPPSRLPPKPMSKPAAPPR